MSTELFLAVLSIPSRNGRINVGRVKPPRARSSCGAGIQSVAMAERVEPAVSGPPSCHHQATRCADPTRIQLKPGGQEDLNAASGESSAFALPRRIPTASALKGMRSFVTTRITGRRELTLISKSAGHRRSRACDGSSDLKRELILHRIKQTIVATIWRNQLCPDSRQVEFFFKSHDEFNDIERVSANRIEQRGVVGDPIAFNAKLTCNDLEYAILAFSGLLRIE